MKPGAKETGDGPRAWLFLRHVAAYEAACRAHSVLPALEPVFEPGPFPIRIQTAADLEAARFDLLAWADPHWADGPASPFWVQSGMVEAVLEPDAEPLVSLVAAGRRRDRGAAPGRRRPCAQDRVRRRGRADPGPGLRAVPRRRRDRGSSPLRAADATDGRANARLLERGGPAGPSDGAGWGGRGPGSCEGAWTDCRTAKKPREIAVDIYGADEVRDGWYPDSGMRSQVRRWIDKADAMIGGGWRRPGSASWVRRVTGIRGVPGAGREAFGACCAGTKPATDGLRSRVPEA